MIGLQLNLVIGMAALALGFGGGLGLGRMQGDQKVGKLQLAYAIEKASIATQTQRAERIARKEEQRRIAKLAEAADVAHKQAGEARTDAQRADYAASELRRAYLTVAGALPKSGVSAHSTPTAGGSATSGSGLVLSNLFSRGDQTLRQCAAALDQSRVAGKACERAYDSLTSNWSANQDSNEKSPALLYLTKSGG